MNGQRQQNETPESRVAAIENDEKQSLSNLYGEEIAARIYSLQVVDEETWRRDEEKYEVAIRTFPEFRKRVTRFLENPGSMTGFKVNLNKLVERIKQENVEQTLQQHTQQRRSLLEQMLAAQRMRVSGQASLPAGAPAEQPVESTAGQTTPVTGDSTPTTGTARTSPQAAQGAKPPLTEDQKKFQAELAAIKNMSTGELIMELAKTGIALFGGKELLSGAASGKIPEDEKKKIKFDPEKNKETVYATTEESYKYVAESMGLDTAKYKVQNVQALLTLFKQNYVFEDKRDKVKEAKIGDIIFFKHKNDKNEDVAYLAGVIIKTGPLTMKTVRANNSVPVEVEVESSDEFKNDWYGFIKIPEQQAEEAAG